MWDDPVWPKEIAADQTRQEGFARAQDVLRPVPYPDKKPLAKLKALLRKTAARTKEALWEAVGQHLGEFTPEECQHDLAHCGYLP